MKSRAPSSPFQCIKKEGPAGRKADQPLSVHHVGRVSRPDNLDNIWTKRDCQALRDEFLLTTIHIHGHLSILDPSTRRSLLFPAGRETDAGSTRQRLEGGRGRAPVRPCTMVH